MKKIEELKQIAAQFPIDPGVYLMKDKSDKIIYVGKAKNLKNRVRSYFNKSADHSSKTKLLVKNIDHIDNIITKSEAEAFLLEATLIKKHKPKYNIRLKDDKAYPYIKLSVKDNFPRLYLSRKVYPDGSNYYGPYTSGYSVKQTIKFLNKNFKIRDCKDSFMSSRKRPCMTHQIGRCLAPCVDLITKEDYRLDIKSAEKFLRGKNNDLLKSLESRMQDSSKTERFELAAQLRDSIKALEHIIERQSVVNADSQMDQDVMYVLGDDRGALLEILHIRAGRLIGNQSHFFPAFNVNDPGEDVREIISSFVIQYYSDNIVPDELLTSVELGTDLTRLMTQLLEEKKKSKVRVYYPNEENSRKLISLAKRNAEEHFAKELQKQSHKEKGLNEIQRKLKLESRPTRIECYDVSHFQGSETVASQVVFVNGSPSKDHYRRYKIKTVKGVDDFASMAEVLERRLKHDEWEAPDLLLIDGGKGQLSAVVKVLKKLGKEELSVVGLAKARTKKIGFDKEIIEETEERFYLPGRENPVVFSTNSSAFQILTGLRDEAHRFAIGYHRKRRDKKSLDSELDYIVGLGMKRKKTLLNRFGSIDEIRTLSVEEIAKLPTFNEVLAERILLQLNEDS
ncbi:MAG: excinuclease ABC subunit UvrC [Bdellovibrionales bacterium]